MLAYKLMKVNLSKYLKIFLSIFLLVALLISFTSKGDFDLIGGSKELVAKVGNIKITKEDLEVSMENALETMTIGKKHLSDLSDKDKKDFQQEILRNLINEKLMMNFTQEIGIDVSDDIVIDQLKKSGVFSNPETGLFDKDIFSKMLTQIGKSEREYLDKMKQSLSLFGLFLPLSIKSNTDISIRNELIFKNLYSNRIIDLIRIKKDDLKIDKISDDQIQKYYETNKEKFKTSEFRAVEYLVLNKDDFKKKLVGDIKIDKKKLQEEFKNQLKSMPRTEKRTFYNFVCAKEEDAKKIYNYVSNLPSDKLKINSTNITSTRNVLHDTLKLKECNVVELYDKQITDTPEALRKMAFDDVSEMNKINKPEKTEFGYQMVLLKNIKHINAEDLKYEIEVGMKDEIAESMLNEKFMKIAQEIDSKKINIIELSKKYDLSIKYFDYVDDDGYFKADKYKYIAEDYEKPEHFSRDVLDVIFTLSVNEMKVINSADDYVVVRLDEKKPIIESVIRPLYEVTFNIKEILIEYEKALKASTYIEHIYTDYKNGLKIEALEKKYPEMIIIKDEKIHNPDWIRMSSNSNSSDYFNAVKIFDENNKDNDAVKLDDTSEIAILKSWSEGKVSNGQRKEIIKMIGSSIQNSETNEMLEQMFEKLKEKYKVKIYEKNLK